MAMFDILKKYKKDTFSFNVYESLREVCNAPNNKSGIYIVATSENIETPIYIGSSGKMQNDGQIRHREGGLYDRICNGKQFGQPRHLSWPIKMRAQQIEELNIRWCITFNNAVTDIPAYIEAVLIQEHFKKFGRLPDWNKEY